MPIKFKPGGLEAEITSKRKERRTFNGRDYILEESLFADFAFVKAYKGDTLGNLVYRYSARNFNQDMASAAKFVIAEVENLVQPGELDPDEIHTPSVYVNRVVKVDYPKRIERRVNR